MAMNETAQTRPISYATELPGSLVRWIWDHPAGFPVNRITVDLGPDRKPPRAYLHLDILEERTAAVRLSNAQTRRTAWFPKQGFRVTEVHVIHPYPTVFRIARIHSGFRQQLTQNQKKLLGINPLEEDS